MPNETLRAIVSLWLLFHLFGIGSALTTNPNALALPSSPIVDSPFNSKLLTSIRSTPILSQYMYALWLDLPHDRWLTYGDFTDADHTIDLDLVFPDGSKQQWQLPPKDCHGEQRERYNIFARRLAVQFYSDAPDKTLLVHRAGFVERDRAKEVQVQIRRHMPLNIDDAAASDPGQHDPNNPRTYTTIYTGSVTLNSLGKGEVHDLGQEARDVAPVTGPRPGTGRQSYAGADGKSAQPTAKDEATQRPIEYTREIGFERACELSGLQNESMGNYFRTLTSRFGAGWTRFWFTPSDAIVLSLLRVLTAGVALWWYLSLLPDVQGWFGPNGMFSLEAVMEARNSPDAGFAISLLDYVNSPSQLWVVYFAGVAAIGLMLLGLFSRVTTIASLVFVLSFIHRRRFFRGPSTIFCRC